MSFTNKFCRQLSGKDYVVSPLSVETVLSMLFQGASGDTEKEIKSALDESTRDAVAEKFKPLMNDLNSLKAITLNVANKIFIMQGFNMKSSFQDVLEDKFMSRADTVDFADSAKCATDINQWVENQTNGKIKDLFAQDSFGELVRLVLVNAIYFQGCWAIPFEKELTTKATFHVGTFKKIDCQMMYMEKRFHNCYSKRLGASLLEIPYEGDEGSMIIILPEKKGGIDEVEKKLFKINLPTLRQTEKFIYSTVELMLPKFKLEYQLDVKDSLQKLGLKKMFNSSSAEFSNIAETVDPLFVGVFVQKAFIEVTEKGTEGAAATGAVVMCLSGPSPTRFIVDHPFMFMVQTRSAKGNNVLFVGKVTKPVY